MLQRLFFFALVCCLAITVLGTVAKRKNERFLALYRQTYGTSDLDYIDFPTTYATENEGKVFDIALPDAWTLKLRARHTLQGAMMPFVPLRVRTQLSAIPPPGPYRETLLAVIESEFDAGGRGTHRLSGLPVRDVALHNKPPHSHPAKRNPATLQLDAWTARWTTLPAAGATAQSGTMEMPRLQLREDWQTLLIEGLRGEVITTAGHHATAPKRRATRWRAAQLRWWPPSGARLPAFGARDLRLVLSSQNAHWDAALAASHFHWRIENRRYDWADKLDAAIKISGLGQPRAPLRIEINPIEIENNFLGKSKIAAKMDYYGSVNREQFFTWPNWDIQILADIPQKHLASTWGYRDIVQPFMAHHMFERYTQDDDVHLLFSAQISRGQWFIQGQNATPAQRAQIENVLNLGRNLPSWHFQYMNPEENTP